MSSEVQIAVIDQQDTQIVLAVPGVQGATGSEIAAGGTANQVLRKASSTNYDTNWSLVTNAMVDSSAAIAGTKISPNFGSQNVVTTGTSTAASFIPTSSSVPTNGVYLPSANNVAISTNGTGRLFVDASGNVGVGAAATARLSATTSSASVLDIYRTATGEARLTFFNNNASSAATIAARVAGLLTDATAGAEGGALIFSTTNAGDSNERLRITSDGKLGLGTNSPSVNLHISSSSSPKLRIADPGTSATSFGQSNSGLELVGGNSNTTAKYMPAIKFGSTDSAFTTTTPKFGAAITAEASEAYDADTDGGMSLAFWTTPNDPGTGGSLQQRLTILNSGNVGIGTTSPGALLDLAASNDGATGTTANNTLRFTDTDANTAADQPIGKIEWYSADTSSPGARAVSYIMSSAAGANSGGDIRFGISANAGTVTEAARITSDGKLLVGTSTARTTYDGSSLTPQVQVEGTTGGTSHLALCRNAASTAGPALVLGKTRQTAAGQAINTAVLSGDILGTIQFEGADGTDFVTAASISAVADAEFNTSGDTTDGPGRLVFSTTADGASSPTERMRITSDAYVRLASGTGGIQFNGDTAAANALDDYEEGTWTPAWSFAGGGSIVTDALSATYTKIGRMVYISCDIRTNTPSSPSGAATLTGLPFSGQGRGITIGYTRRWATDMPNLKAYTNAGIVLFTKHASNAVSESALDASDFSATTSYNNLSIAGCYVV